MGLFDGPASRAFLGQPTKVLTDDEKAQAAEHDARVKKVEKLVVFQEKLDSLTKLQAELGLMKLDAMQSSPGAFAGGFGSPGLHLGADGLAGLAARGGVPLTDATTRVGDWLQQYGPQQMKAMSEERQRYIQGYQDIHNYLKTAIAENERLSAQAERQNYENSRLKTELSRTQQQLRHNAFDDYQEDDGADPFYEGRRRRRGHSFGGYRGGGPGGRSPGNYDGGYGSDGYHERYDGRPRASHYDDYDPRLPPRPHRYRERDADPFGPAAQMSPQFARARAAHDEYDRMYGRHGGGPRFY